MKFYGKAQEVAEKILEAFKSGNLPKALAPVFIRRKDGVPCRQWSWGNQLLCMLHGTNDARGMKQWNDVRRKVKKGSKAFDILVPLTKTIRVKDEKGEERSIPVVYGFRCAAVFGVEVTEGPELPKVDSEIPQWLNTLPLIEVAHAWGLKVDAIDGRERGALGSYRPGLQITLGVKNLSTWAHELVHAADDKLGKLTERGQHWRSETVAELGGAIVLEALGLETESDRGGCWEYITQYAEEADITPIEACTKVLKRTCDAVNLILNESAKLALEKQIAI